MPGRLIMLQYIGSVPNKITDASPNPRAACVASSCTMDSSQQHGTSLIVLRLIFLCPAAKVCDVFRNIVCDG